MPRKKRKNEDLYIPPAMRRREPPKKKAKVANSLSWRRPRDKFGKWKKGLSGSTPGKSRDAVKAMTGNTSFLERVAALSDQDAVARKVVRLARRGDWAALQIQMQALNLPARAASGERDYSKLDDNEMKFLMRIYQKLDGIPVPEITAAPAPVEDEIETIVERTARGSDREDDDDDLEPPPHKPEAPPSSLKPTDHPANDPDTVEYQQAAQEKRDALAREKLNGPTPANDLTTGLKGRRGAFGLPTDYWRN